MYRYFGFRTLQVIFVVETFLVLVDESQEVILFLGALTFPYLSQADPSDASSLWRHNGVLFLLCVLLCACVSSLRECVRCVVQCLVSWLFVFFTLP